MISNPRFIVGRKVESGGQQIIRAIFIFLTRPSTVNSHDIRSGRATAIFVGAREPKIPANNLPSQKPAPTGILWLIDGTSYNIQSIILGAGFTNNNCQKPTISKTPTQWQIA